MEIVLNNMKLLDYDKYDVEHVKLLNELLNGSDSFFIHDIENRLVFQDNKKDAPFGMGFVVSMNDVCIGYLYISDRKKDEVFLEYSVVKEFRGMKFGKMLLREVSNFLLENYNIRDIVLDIDPSNLASVMTAVSVGYIEDDEEYLKRNMMGKILYRMDNYNYINKRKK